jgi:hypothetical protein
MLTLPVLRFGYCPLTASCSTSSGGTGSMSDYVIDQWISQDSML